jgi:hypothetical protein
MAEAAADQGNSALAQAAQPRAEICGKLERGGSMDLDTRVPSCEDPVVGEITRRLIEVYHPERVYLFGSAARGDAGANSDYDLLLVVPDETPAEFRRSGPGYRAIWRLGVAADVLVYRRSVFDRQLALRASLPSSVVREGRLLYAA